MTGAGKLVEVADLSVSFGDRPAVRDVSFVLERGETLALVGESGSGKSTVALSLLRLVAEGANVRGRITLDGQSVLDASPRALRRLRGGLAGMIFQEPMTSLNPLHRIGRQVAEAVSLHLPLRGAALRARSVALLEQAGFADAANRREAYPHQLSGGQRQRVMIAMALAADPPLLIADEPTTALDVTIQAQILRLLAELKAARGLALLLISHDLAIVRRYADRVCVMKDGRMVETGPVSRVFTQPQHPYTRMLLATEPKGRPAPVPPASPTVLEGQDVRVIYPIRRGVLRREVGAVRAVDGVSIAVRAGETVGLVGESGSGKSTSRAGAAGAGALGRTYPLRGRGDCRLVARGAAQAAGARAVRVPGSLWQPVAAPVRGRHRGRGVGDPSARLVARRARGAGGRIA